MSKRPPLPTSRPLHQVFRERVINIPALQRERAAVTEKYVADFFEHGRVPGEIGKYLWPLDGEPEPFPMGIVIAGVEKAPISPAMARAWNAAIAAKDASFVAPLRAGKLIATGTYLATGERRDLNPAELMPANLWIEIRDGTLFVKGRDGKWVELWTAIMLRDAGELPPERATEPLDPAPDVSPRRKPGKRPTKDWPTHVARELIRRARAGEEMPTAPEMLQFCEDALDWQPDIRQMQRLLRKLGLDE